MVSRAAIELDNASRGETVDFQETQRFAAFLQESLHQQISQTGAHPAWLDVNTMDVVGQALVEVEGEGKVRTVQDVLKHAHEMVAEIEKASATEKSSELERLRRFCVAFGNSLLSHRAALKQDGPNNPHRR
jgi:hypothetical protein